MDYDDEAIKMMSISIHSKLKQLKRPAQFHEGTLGEASIIMPEHFQDEAIKIVPTISHADSTTNHDTSQAQQTIIAHHKQVPQLSFKTTHRPVLPVPNPMDILKGALQSKGLDALKQHFQKTWSLYLTNTGGQMEFQEVLPLLVSGPSMFFFTFRLD